MLKAFIVLLHYELRALARHQALWLLPLLFFILMLSLFGIGLGSDNTLLEKASGAIIWITFFITSLLTVDNLLRMDAEEGVLAQWVVSDIPVWWLFCSKAIALWIASCLPLIILLPLVGLTLQLDAYHILILSITVLAGSPALSFMATLGATLTVSLPRAGLLLALIMLPLFLPVLILGESALQVDYPQWPTFQVALLAALSVLSMTLAPHAAALALTSAMEE